MFIQPFQFLRSKQALFARLCRQWIEPNPVLLDLSVQRNHRDAGFTLIEIMVVIAIIGSMREPIIPLHMALTLKRLVME